MLQAHSILWHYLWLAPHVLQLVLAAWLVHRKRHKVLPVFFAYLLYEAVEEFTLYALDSLPSVTWETFWRAYCIGLVFESLLKFAVIGELFSHLVSSWPTVAKMGNRLISGAGAGLVLLATLAAANTPIDNPQHAIISQAHILEQGLFIIECGLIFSLLLFAAYFKLGWNNVNFGIALGLGISASVHLGTWAVMANGFLFDKRYLLDLLNMATYHLSVLIWFYYLLVPEKTATTSAVPLPEHNLAVWNRELERLLQQ